MGLFALREKFKEGNGRIGLLSWLRFHPLIINLFIKLSHEVMLAGRQEGRLN